MSKQIIFLWGLMGCLIFFVAGSEAQEPSADSSGKRIVLKTNQTDTTQIQSKSPRSAMIRSLLFPGWGQWYNNKKFKALLIFGTQAGLLVNSISLNQKLVQSQDEWDREFYINNRNLSVWWLVGVTLFSITDAFVDAHLSDFDESPELTNLKICPMISAGGFGCQISLAYYF